MKPHECDICKKIFSRPSHVIRHKKDVHKIFVCSEGNISVEKKYKCDACEKTFSRPKHVRRHHASAHTLSSQKKEKRYSQQMLDVAKLTLLPKAPLQIKSESPVKHISRTFFVHVCEICEKKFSRPALLQRHKLKVHRLGVLPLENMVKTEHQCSMCNKHFKFKKNMRKHERIVHGFIHPSTGHLKCSECKNSFFTVKEFNNHFSVQHRDIELVTETFLFETDTEFREWKSQVEKTSSSSFVCARTYSNSSSEAVKLFICHRNGKFKSQSTGQRHIKRRGTDKIEYFCPARIYQTTKHDGKVESKYISKHVGHQCDSGRLRLSKSEKDEIACQLQIGVPMQQILLKVSENVSDNSRISAMNMQDIRNVASSYNINSSEKRNSDDVLSVDSWVQQMLGEENSPILLYKLPGEVKEEYPGLQEEDFLLAFMNEAQREIFKQYGESVISIDSTHGTNMYDIQLTSIIVKDSNWEGFPVAFLWCNKQSEPIFNLFFSAVKNRIGQLNCPTFMSDDFSAYYNAWEKVFGPARYHLLCDWHVKRAWTKNLSSGPHKICNLQKRKLVQNHLTLMINEVDIATFTRLLEMKELLIDDETRSFWNYFQKNYANRIPLWAHCYRTGAKVNTNMAIERWHKDLKYNSDLNGKCGGRLDKAIHSLIKSLRLKLMNRLSSISRGKLTKKVVLLRKAHENASENFNNVSVTSVDDYWHVSSFSTTDKVYKVKQIKLDHLHACNLMCEECHKCCHELVCNCPESAIKYNYCKHCHIVGLLLTQECASETNSSENIVPLKINASQNADSEKTAILKELQSIPQNSLQNEANEAVQRTLEMIALCTSDEQFKLVISSMNTLRANLKALESSNKYLKPVDKLIPNKNIEPQRKFPLKKTKRKNVKI